MRVRRRSNDRVVALDLGAAAVQAVEATSSRGMVAAASIPRIDTEVGYDEAELATIVAALRRRGFTAGEAAVILPKALLRFVPVDIPPPDSGAPVEQIARAQVAHERGEGAGFELALWIPTGADASQSERAVAVSCAHNDADPLLDALQRAGLTPRSLHPPAAAIACTARIDDPARRVMLDAGWSGASVIVVEHGKVLFERSMGSHRFGRVVTEIGRALGVDAETARWVAGRGRNRDPALVGRMAPILRGFGERLAEDIASSIAFIERCWPGEGLQVLDIVGGGGEDDDLIDWLDASIGPAVRPLMCRTVRHTATPAQSAAAGLALASVGARIELASSEVAS